MAWKKWLLVLLLVIFLVGLSLGGFVLWVKRDLNNLVWLYNRKPTLVEKIVIPFLNILPRESSKGNFKVFESFTADVYPSITLVIDGVGDNGQTVFGRDDTGLIRVVRPLDLYRLLKPDLSKGSLEPGNWEDELASLKPGYYWVFWDYQLDKDNIIYFKEGLAYAGKP